MANLIAAAYDEVATGARVHDRLFEPQKQDLADLADPAGAAVIERTGDRLPEMFLAV